MVYEPRQLERDRMEELFRELEPLGADRYFPAVDPVEKGNEPVPYENN